MPVRFVALLCLVSLGSVTAVFSDNESNAEDSDVSKIVKVVIKHCTS